MRAFIVGCGRVGARLAERLAAAGHEVTIVDVRTEAFSRLGHGFPGRAVRGDGTDEDVLRRNGADGADIFFALTEGDNRNILAAQLAAETLGVPSVVAKINDPVRADAYTSLGIATLCRTTMLTDALTEYAGVGGSEAPRGVQPPTASHDHGPGDSRARGRAAAGATAGRSVAAGGATGALEG